MNKNKVSYYLKNNLEHKTSLLFSSYFCWTILPKDNLYLKIFIYKKKLIKKNFNAQPIDWDCQIKILISDLFFCRILSIHLKSQWQEHYKRRPKALPLFSMTCI